MRVLSVVWTILVFQTVVKCARILGVFHMASPSHYMACSALMKILAEKGHDVTVIAGFTEKNPPKNYRQIFLDGLYEKLQVFEGSILRIQSPVLSVSLNGYHDNSSMSYHQILLLFQLPTIEIEGSLNWFEFTPSPYGMPIFFHSMSNALIENTFNHTKFQDFMKTKQHFDAVIIEEFQAEAIKYVAHHFNAPLIVYSALDANDWTNPFQGNPDTPSYHPNLFLNHLTNHMSFFERVENTLMYVFCNVIFHFFTFPAQDRLLHKYYPDAPDLKEIAYNVSLVLLNSDPSVHEPLPKVPSMKDIGGFHISKPKPLPQDLQTVLDNAKNGVIYFSLGSNIKSKDMPKEKKEFIMRKLSKLKETVIWKFEDPELPGKPDNVVIRKWLPQNDILAHKNVKLFISHGGLFSTMEAVYHGKPVLALSIFAEQKMNGKRAEANGFARHIPFKELDEEKFNELLDDLLNNPKYTENAKARSQIMRDKPLEPADAINYWVEYVIRHKGTPHLRVAALDLEWYQYLLLDVVLFISAVVLAFVFLMRYLIRSVFRKKPEVTKRKKKE